MVKMPTHSSDSSEGGEGYSELAQLPNMIRMNFDASTFSECRQMIQRYCETEILPRGGNPSQLTGKYRHDRGTQEIIVSARCLISPQQVDISLPND